MLLPLEESKQKAAAVRRDGELDLGAVHLKRQGKASVLTSRNPRYLNAEDETTLPALETAVDIALLDPKTEVCVLRGGTVTHTKHAGRRLFGAGINLTHLYEGKIRYLWYLIRDLGLREQALPRPRACRTAARRRLRSRSCGSPRSRGSPSAGTARSC